MQSAGSDRILLAIFAALVVSSVGVKGLAGPPKDGLYSSRSGQVEDQLVNVLRSESFATSVRRGKFQSSIVFANRGDCRLSVRDARDAEASSTIFARDAATIGPVRYLYRGRDFAAPPTIRMRIGRLEAELLDRAGLDKSAPVPLALAASPQCGSADFGLADFRQQS